MGSLTTLEEVERMKYPKLRRIPKTLCLICWLNGVHRPGKFTWETREYIRASTEEYRDYVICSFPVCRSHKVNLRKEITEARDGREWLDPIPGYENISWLGMS
jgi:hypothetical protein